MSQKLIKRTAQMNIFLQKPNSQSATNKYVSGSICTRIPVYGSWLSYCNHSNLIMVIDFVVDICMVYCTYEGHKLKIIFYL